MNIGSQLRSARLSRKRSIEQIASATKIPPSLLRAIEKDAFDRVPGGLFTRGYLRAYAREVGLDPETVVQQYYAEHESAPPEPQGARTAHDAEAAAPDPASESHAGQIIQVGVIVIIVGAYFASLRPSTPAVHPALAAIAPAAAAAPAPPAPEPVGTTGQVDTVRPLEVELRADGPCWVAASADGATVMARLMNAGDRENLKVGDHLTLRVGDPATLNFAIDGVPAKPLGAAGRAVTVEIDRRNYETLLQPRQRDAVTADRPVADEARAAACCPRIP